MINFCLVYAYKEKNGRYPTDEELDELGIKIPKFVEKCKDCPNRKNEECVGACIYKT